MKEEVTLNIKLSPFALRLRSMRLNKELSLADLSKLTGIPVNDIVSYESDKKTPNKKNFEKIIKILS